MRRKHRGFVRLGEKPCLSFCNGGSRSGHLDAWNLKSLSTTLSSSYGEIHLLIKSPLILRYSVRLGWMCAGHGFWAIGWGNSGVPGCTPRSGRAGAAERFLFINKALREWVRWNLTGVNVIPSVAEGSQNIQLCSRCLSGSDLALE